MRTAPRSLPYAYLMTATAGLLLGAVLVSGCRHAQPNVPNGTDGQGGGPAWGAGVTTPTGQGGTAGAPLPVGASPAGFGGAAPTTTTAAPPPTATATATPPPYVSSTATGTATSPPPFPLDPKMALTPLQQKFAPGAKEEGPSISGMIQAGQSMSTQVTLAPSGTRCYTAIGLAAPPVTDLLLELVVTPPLPGAPPITVAQSQGASAQPVLGGAPTCFKNLLPIPAPATFKVTARAGSGLIVAQLYAK